MDAASLMSSVALLVVEKMTLYKKMCTAIKEEAAKAANAASQTRLATRAALLW
jgi:hypothetical protein